MKVLESNSNKAKRKICVVTSSRADYGLLYWLIKAIHDDPVLELQLVATGMQCAPSFGLTYKVIEQDGFMVADTVEMLLESDTPASISKSIGLGLIGFADTFQRLRPDIVVILGDRYEILAVAIAAMNAQIPIAHIAGGESTEGGVDEAIRHSLTKMALFHFPAAEEQRQRIIQMGEDPSRIYCYGKPGLDNLRKLNLLDRRELAKRLKFFLGAPIFLITFHPVTLEENTSLEQFSALLEALDSFPEATLIFTKSNSDAFGRVILSMISDYIRVNNKRAKAFTSLGQFLYLSCLKCADVVIGNSSSGLIEAPALRIPTVNIGDRQRGRVSAHSVINCEPNIQDIFDAVRKAMDPSFRKSLLRMKVPYDSDGFISLRIKDTLKTIDLTDGILKKRFYVPSQTNRNGK